jgi:hypothetical protein
MWTQPLVRGEGTFVGLGAGNYALRVEMGADGGTLVRKLHLASPVRSVISLRAASSAAASPLAVPTSAGDQPAARGSHRRW